MKFYKVFVFLIVAVILSCGQATKMPTQSGPAAPADPSIKINAENNPNVVMIIHIDVNNILLGRVEIKSENDSSSKLNIDGMYEIINNFDKIKITSLTKAIGTDGLSLKEKYKAGTVFSKEYENGKKVNKVKLYINQTDTVIFNMNKN